MTETIMPAAGLVEGQRVQRVEDGVQGTVALTGSLRIRVQFDDKSEGVYDRIGDKRLILLNQVTLDLSSWLRLAEVEAYAKDRKIGKPEAIKRLVNMGLSYLPAN